MKKYEKPKILLKYEPLRLVLDFAYEIFYKNPTKNPPLFGVMVSWVNCEAPKGPRNSPNGKLLGYLFYRAKGGVRGDAGQ